MVRALGLGDLIGSLTPGKRADLILIRTTDRNIAPLAQIEATVVHSATPANVDTVMVDGRLIKRHGHLIYVDVPNIVERAEKSAFSIRSTNRNPGYPEVRSIALPVESVRGGVIRYLSLGFHPRNKPRSLTEMG
jgi:hypothetical protein